MFFDVYIYIFFLNSFREKTPETLRARYGKREAVEREKTVAARKNQNIFAVFICAETAIESTAIETKTNTITCTVH